MEGGSKRRATIAKDREQQRKGLLELGVSFLDERLHPLPLVVGPE